MLSEPDFEGRIGRTYHESEPSWPAPPAGLGGPNVVMVVLDDTGFAHFNCYGSTLATPNIDRLASGGLRYTGFHTTALCSPTRACLLTGRNHHAVGMRGISNWNTGYPHMRGGITPRAATIAELLRTHGYATYAAGKWHLAPMEETSAAGPHHNWPLQKGFDRFYGFLQGETDQFHPELTHDNHHIDPPASAGYHISEDLIDQSCGWIRDLVSCDPTVRSSCTSRSARCMRRIRLPTTTCNDGAVASTRVTTFCANAGSGVNWRWASSQLVPRWLRAIPACRRGTTSPRTRRSFPAGCKRRSPRCWNIPTPRSGV